MERKTPVEASVSSGTLAKPLGEARALVIGVGGLGAPALLALASAGVRNIGIMDPDRVEVTNLHRQIIYSERDVGSPKVDRAKAFVEARFPEARVTAIRGAFEGSTHDVVRDYDVVLDGTDRLETKLALSDVCVDRGIPYVFGGVLGYEGQVLGVRPGASACLRCLFHEAPAAGAPTCEEVGILGPVAGIVGAKQARVAVELLAGVPTATDRIWVYEGSADQSMEIRLARLPSCRGCGSEKHLRGAQPRGLDVSPDTIEAPTVDLTGLVCPHTFIETRKALERLPGGGRLWVQLSSDESARNVPASAIAAGHRVLARLSDGRRHRILLERGEE